MKYLHEEAFRDYCDNSMSLYQYCKKWGINLKEIFPEMVEDEETYGDNDK